MNPLILTADHACPESDQTAYGWSSHSHCRPHNPQPSSPQPTKNPYTKLTPEEEKSLEAEVQKAVQDCVEQGLAGNRINMHLYRTLQIEKRYRGLSYDSFRRFIARCLRAKHDATWEALFDAVVLPLLDLDGYGLRWPDEIH